MSTLNDTTPIKQYVWDPLVRIFHWLLVAAFITSYITAEEYQEVHVISGYTIVSLLVIRIIWGFIGSKYARFSNFIKRPATVLKYLHSLKNSEPEDYRGHNPAGGWMILLLIISLGVTTFAGLKLYGLEGHGPLASTPVISDVTVNASYGREALNRHDSDKSSDNTSRYTDYDNHYDHDDEHESDAEEFWEDIHEFFVHFTIFLILIHIMGVVISSRLHDQNLVKAMFTGYKDNK